MDARTSVVARRAKSIPGVFVAFALLVGLFPIAAPLAVVVDVLRGKFRLPLLRLMAFGIAYFGWEVIGVITATALWVASGFGTAIDTELSQRAHRWMQMRWLRSLLINCRRFLGLRIEVDGDECLTDGPLIMLARHASIIDTLLPGLIADQRGMKIRYVMKQELLVDPSIDLFAQRLPNYFVDRSGVDTAAEVESIRKLASESGPDEVFAIFPEGTRWTDAKREQVQRSLEKSRPERAILFKDRLDTMPPRAGGTLAVLDGLPDADIVVLSYVGLEKLAGPLDALSVIPFRDPVTVELRRIPRSVVPVDPDEQRQWLDDEWETVDLWVRTHRTP